MAEIVFPAEGDDTYGVLGGRLYRRNRLGPEGIHQIAEVDPVGQLARDGLLRTGQGDADLL